MKIPQTDGTITVSYGYDTVKHNYDDIKYKEVNFSDYLTDNISEGIPDFNAIPPLSSMINNISVEYKDNMELRNRLINTVETMSNKKDASNFIDEFSKNLSDYYYGKNINPDIIGKLSQEDTHSQKRLSSDEIKSIDINNFTSKIISNLSKLENDISHQQTNKYLQGVLEGYNTFVHSNNINKAPIYA